MDEEYNDDMTQEELDGILTQATQVKQENIQLNQALNQMQDQGKTGNFLHHQLDTSEMLDKLEHFYRGEYPKSDGEGNVTWQEPVNKDLITFNEFGISQLMEILTKYIDKGTILSSYPEERIYSIIAAIGNEMILFLLCNYQKMGMDTYYKKTKFRLIITTTTHIIENTYRRALHGKTMEEINQSRIIGQFGDRPQLPGSTTPQKRSWGQRLFGG